MNYQKIYDDLILKAKQENRKKVKGDTYYENHHIIPICLGGLNDKDNLVLLTGREHFVAHKLLAEIYPLDKNMFHAYFMMAFRKSGSQNRFYKISSREFERLRVARSEYMKTNPASKETRLKISKANKGKKKPDGFGDNVSKWMTGRIVSEETRLKQAKNRIGKKASESTKALMSSKRKGAMNANFGSTAIKGDKNFMWGKKHTDETKDKISKSKLGVWTEKQQQAVINRPKLMCPHCGKFFDRINLHRWHLDNCKHSKIKMNG